MALVLKSQPKTVYRLMLISFTLVAIPLVVGLLILFFQIDRLSAQMQASVNQSAVVMENSRLVTAQALSLKRSAEQYLILRDRTLLSRYRDQRELFKHSLSALIGLPVKPEMNASLLNIKNAEAGLAAQLVKIDANQNRHVSGAQDKVPEKPVELDQLVTSLESIPAQASDFVAAARRQMAMRASDSKQSLIILLVTLVPTAIALALMSSAVINRPLKKIISVIHKLGEGEFPDDTRVGGPQNIEVLGEHLHWLSERLSRIEQQKVVFLQNVSHELKTPLTAIREGTDLMREQVIGNLNKEQIEVLEIMNQSTRLLQNQLESLLDINLALTMDEPYPQVQVELKLVIDNLVNKLRLILKSRQISVEHDTPSVCITGNQTQLENLFENILTNAIKFSPKGGKISISTEVNSDGIDVIIKDTGPGFHKDDIQKAFEPFFRGRKSPNSRINGTGLGLSIAKRYAGLHGGRVEIEKSSVGAAVKVFLPVGRGSDINACSLG